MLDVAIFVKQSNNTLQDQSLRELIQPQVKY